ncbi:hypothetical protein K504DRAFT_462325, partial [Pleomassaria siparia CBS 279.74]
MSVWLELNLLARINWCSLAVDFPSALPPSLASDTVQLHAVRLAVIHVEMGYLGYVMGLCGWSGRKLCMWKRD